MFGRDRHGALVISALLLLGSCMSETWKPERLMLAVTSDAPADGANLDVLRFLFAADGVRFPADPTEEAFNAQLIGTTDPVTAPVYVEIDFLGTAFTGPEVRVLATAWSGGAVRTRYEGTLDLSLKEVVAIHLSVVGSACDVDGDGFLDCSQPGCCDTDSQLGDCEPGEASANPWGEELDCEPCGDILDQDCRDGDQVCVDADGDESADCSDCDPADSAVGEGLPELCDDKDNDCDGDTDEDLTIDGEPVAKGGPCGAGVCEGGTIVCADDGSASCSTAANAYAETCDDGLDNDCDTVTDEGCGDADGDGVTTEDGDCDDHDASVFPGAPEPCCLASLIGDPAAIELCDKVGKDKCQEICEADKNDYACTKVKSM